MRNQWKKLIREKEGRNIRSEFDSPQLVSILPLSTNACLNSFLRLLDSYFDRNTSYINIQGKNKIKLEIMPILTKEYDPLEILNILTVAERVILIIQYDEEGKTEIDDLGKEILSLLRGIGIPELTIVAQKKDGWKSQKEKSEIIHKSNLAIKNELNDEIKIIPVYDKKDMEMLLRQMSKKSHHIPEWRNQRSSILIKNIYYEENDEEIFRIDGFIRGSDLTANRNLSITGFQDFQIEAIYEIEEKTHEVKELLAKPDPNEQHPMTIENKNEIQMDEVKSVNSMAMTNAEIIKKKLPKGTSEYQAAWYPSDESDLISLDSDLEEDIKEMEELDEARVAYSDADDMNFSIDVDDDWIQDLETKTNQSITEIDDEIEDEVNLLPSEKAREKFKYYRGLKSFVTSKWNVDEDLPDFYERIFTFENYKVSSKLAKNEFDCYSMSTLVHSGKYVGIYLKSKDIKLETKINMKNKVDKYKKGEAGPLVAFSLFRDETKLTLLNYYVKKTLNFKENIKSAQELILYTGNRIFKTKPIYSTNAPNIDKHKLIREYKNDDFVCASFYGPVTYPPSPILAFYKENSKLKLAYTGMLYNCDPNRVILKKAILTGKLRRVKNTKGIVQGMFYNSDDVEWFKPIQLWTKNGKIGHIITHLGELGLMKCYFNMIVQQNDLICLSLYKRIFPPFDVEENKNELE